MMVDSLDGQLHQAYGTLPNMAWVIGTSGEVVYKADWTDAREIDQVLQKLVGRREIHARTEVPQRSSSMGDFMQGLLDVPGPRASREFVEAVEANSGEGAGGPMRQWLADHGHPID